MPGWVPYLVSSPIDLGKQVFLLHQMELESRGSKLLTYFQDYSRNFLFLELIWPSGGKDYYSYGHILWLLSLREGKKKAYWIFLKLLNVKVIIIQKTLRAVVTFSISTVTSIKDHKSTANFTCRLAQCLLYRGCWENLLVKNLSYSGEIGKEAFGSHFL